MKRILLSLLFLLLISSVLYSQNDTLGWRKGGLGALNFSQTSLVNWAEGGENNITSTALLNLFAKYRSKLSYWDNTLDLAYGLTAVDLDDVRKNDDKIDFLSNYGRYAFGKFYYSALLNFKSQFTPGYNYPNDSVVVSRFLAPGYLTIAAGLTWKPVNYFSVFFTPVSGRFIFVTDDSLSNAGAYGVEPGKKLKSEFGATVLALFDKEIAKNVGLKSKLTLFNNYTDKRTDNRANIDVDWQTGLNLKVNDFLNATVSTHVIYDDDVAVPLTEKINGVKVQTGTGKRVQFKEVIAIGFSYKF